MCLHYIIDQVILLSVTRDNYLMYENNCFYKYLLKFQMRIKNWSHLHFKSFFLLFMHEWDDDDVCQNIYIY